MIGAVLHLEEDLYDVLRGPGLTEYMDEHLFDLRQLGMTHMFIVDLTVDNRIQEWRNYDAGVEKVFVRSVDEIYEAYPDSQFVIMETQANLENGGVTDYDTITTYDWPDDFILVTAPDISKVNFIDDYKTRDRVQFLNISQVPVVWSATALILAMYERSR